MSTDQAMSSLWYVLALVLVGSALLARRMPAGGVIRLALVWVVIFAVLLALFDLGQKSGLFSSRLTDNAPAPSTASIEAPTPPATRVEGGALRIPIAPDGHYWVEGTINGTTARFLIDSGASVTALSVDTARSAGLNFDLNGPGVPMATANGRIEVQRSKVSTLAIGPIHASDVDVVVSPSFGEVNVIGMNTLSRLKSWGVEEGVMVLTP